MCYKNIIRKGWELAFSSTLPRSLNNSVMVSLVARPFLEPKTRHKVKFIYADDANSMKIMEDLFDINCLDSAFGRNNAEGFDLLKYAESMKEDDERMSFWTRANDTAEGASNLASMMSLNSIDDASLKLDASLVDESGDEREEDLSPFNEDHKAAAQSVK
ncbi:hypothetical protein Dimus_024859 [Dionaea muscipula]